MTQRLIHCVGLSDEDLAHVRLLLRAARKELRDPWTWGSEARSDLVIANPRRLIGDSARRRAQQRGVACAQILETDDAKPNGPFLLKPIRRDRFVALLNRVGYETLAESVDDDLDDIFADMDLGMVDLSQLETEHPGKNNAFVPSSQRGESFAVIAPTSLTDAPPGYSAMPAAREPARGAAAFDRAYRAARKAVSDPHPDPAPEPEPEISPDIPLIDADSTYPLADYITNNLLVGAARITLPHLQALTLDPERKQFLAQGSLRALEPYARQPLRYGDWQRLGAELESLRRHAPARPLAMLVWVDRFLRAGGFLPRHVNAGGLFHLTRRLELGEDYPHAFRVGNYMTTPRKLHEVARLSGIDLAEVFDIVSAYDAIGYMEWTRRES